MLIFDCSYLAWLFLAFSRTATSLTVVKWIVRSNKHFSSGFMQEWEGMKKNSSKSQKILWSWKFWISLIVTVCELLLIMNHFEQEWSISVALVKKFSFLLIVIWEKIIGYDLISEPSLFQQNIPFKFNIYQSSLDLNPITDESFKSPLKSFGASFRFVNHKWLSST